MTESVRWDLVADPTRFNRGFRDAERTSSHFGTRFTASMGRMAGVGLRAFGGLGVAAAGLGVAAAVMGVKTLAANEQAEVGFKHLLGSGKQAKKFLAELKRFAAETPFELPGIEQAAQLLLGAGESARKILPDLRAVGDAASTTTNPVDAFNRTVLALSQSMNKGKLQTEEILQAVEAGIPVWKLLSEATGKPIPKLQELATKGKLLTKDVLPLLFDQMHKDYGGAMQEQSTTLRGLWSTLMDTLSQGLADTLVPLEDELKGGLKGAIGIAQDALKRAADFVTNTVVPSIKTLKRWWDHNQEALDTLADTLGVAFSGAASDATTASDDLRTSQEKLYDIFSTILEVGLRVAQGWDKLAIAAGNVSKWTLNVGIAAAMTVNAIDRLSGGAGHAADSMIASMRRMRDQTETQLAKIRGDAAALQRQIDKLHGKRINFEAADHVTPVIEGIIQGVRKLHNVVVGFGGITRPGAPVAFQHGTMFVPSTGLALVHKGEIVIPPAPSERIRRGDALFGTSRPSIGSLTIQAITNASAADIAREVAWQQKTSGR